MKKILSVVLALAMVLSMCSFAMAETTGYDGTITIWVAEAVTGLTAELAEQFKAEYPEYANITVNVEAVGEGDAASNMITDVEGGADIYGFAQDQLARLVAAGALETVEENNAAIIAAENDAGAVAAATMGDTLYAYPMTSDNGYFLYYDSSVVTDPSTLEGIIADCEAAGKNFYMEIDSGWYITAFFFGTGCTLTYDSNDEGALVACNSTIASAEGVAAMKAMIALAKSSAFKNGSSASTANDYAAIVDGTWDSSTVSSVLGDNYAAAKLPTFTVDGTTYQMGGFGGFKLMGIKPQVDDAKLACCDALALYLTSEAAQMARYDAVGWGPSNLVAQTSDAVKANPALAALAAQLNYCVPQGQYPGDYWTLATALGDDIIAGNYNESTDEELLAVLTTFEETCKSYAAN